MTLTRISITIPRDLVRAADKRAKELDRSRSWVLVEALRTYLAPRRAAAVREPAPPPYAAVPVDAASEIAAARRLRLKAELELSPEERVRRAEELGRLGRARQRRGSRAQIIGFDTYEDFYEWKRARLIGL